MKKRNKINRKGQIALVVLLVSAVILTLGLSASRKAVTDTKVDTNDESLKQAFNAAESGINNYLSNTNPNYVGVGVGATVTSASIGGGNSLTSDGVVLSGTNQLFWLVDHNSDGSVGTNYYSSGTVNITVASNFTGAIKVDYFYKNGTTYSVSRSGYNFSSVSPTVDGFTYNSGSTVPISIIGTPLLLVVTPISGSTATTLSLSGASNFPVQGEDLTSVGTADNGTKTQIKTRNIYQVPSFLFDAIVVR